MFNDSNEGQPLECGWIDPDNRTQEVKDTHEEIMGEMPAFQIEGSFKAVQKVALWDAARAILGRDLRCFFQEVGSCVGNGKAKTEEYTMINEILLDPSKAFVHVYEPYGYAQSRVCAGMSGGGDGSTGSGAAKAATKYGLLQVDFDKPNMPYKYTDDDKTVVWPGKVDQAWGRNGAPSQYVTEGSKHLIKTTAKLSSSDQVRDALVNKYGVTCASNWGGMMKPPVVNGVLLNHRVTTWSHQMSYSAYWDHPDLGEIFWVQNSWGWNAHGVCPSGAPGGGFWVKKSEVDWVCSQNEVFAYSQFNGFPADMIPWQW